MSIKIARIVFIFLLVSVPAASAAAQTGAKDEKPEKRNRAMASAAYAEVLLRKSILEVELADLLVRYTDEFPKVGRLRFEIAVLERSLDRMLALDPEETGKLTPALGKMLVQKAVYETELNTLQKKYNDEHPEVKRAKRRLEIFEKAVKQIL